MTALFIGLPQMDIDYRRDENGVTVTLVGDEPFTTTVNEHKRGSVGYGNKFHVSGVHVAPDESVDVALSDGLHIELSWKKGN